VTELTGLSAILCAADISDQTIDFRIGRTTVRVRR